MEGRRRVAGIHLLVTEPRAPRPGPELGAPPGGCCGAVSGRGQAGHPGGEARAEAVLGAPSARSAAAASVPRAPSGADQAPGTSLVARAGLADWGKVKESGGLGGEAELLAGLPQGSAPVPESAASRGRGAGGA